MKKIIKGWSFFDTHLNSSKIIDLDDNMSKLFLGDSMKMLKRVPSNHVQMVITSPPYCMKKEYEDSKDNIESFKENHKKFLPEVIRVLKKGGSLCWQVGYHVNQSEIMPLDYYVYSIIEEINLGLPTDEKIKLRNRIIWTFGHGLHSTKRLSGRHETILWFTKGDDYVFNLNEIRVPQKYPGKTHHKGKNKGDFSGNPMGKNPSDNWFDANDIWDIPNVKSKHPEKTEHPCQFPSAIPIRLIKAFTNEGDIVMDPFVGSGTTAVSAIITKRLFLGGEFEKMYYEIAKNRISDAVEGVYNIRPDVPVKQPNGNEKVALKPSHFI